MDEVPQPRPATSSRMSLAERLRTGREAKGVSPEVASSQSAVPIRYVRMFEEGEYPVVADPAYLAHFVRRYAGYLGLDAEAASRDLIAETEPETALRRAGKIAALQREPNSSTAPRVRLRDSAAMGKSAAVDSKKFPTLRGAHGGRRIGSESAPLVVAVVVAVVGLAGFHLWSNRAPEPEPVAESPEPALPQIEPTVLPEQTPVPVPTEAPPAAPPTSVPTSEPAPTAVPTTPVRLEPTAGISDAARARAPVRASSPAPGASFPPPAASAPPRPRRRINPDDEASEALRLEQLERLRQQNLGTGAVPPSPPQR